MAIVYSENVIEIAVVQDYAGRPAVNVWHMRHDEELASPTLVEVVRDFANNWQDHMTGLQVDGVSVRSFDYRSLDPNDGTVGSLVPDAAKPTTGQISLEGQPPNVALLVTKQTANRPRGRRDGRSFLVGVAETVVNERGIINPPQVTSWQEDVDAFYNGISDTSLDWAGDVYPVVLETTPASREPGDQTVNIGSRRVTSLVVDPLVSSQRDRLR